LRGVRISVMRQARESPLRFSIYSVSPQCFLWSGDGLRALDNILGQGEKRPLGCAVVGGKIVGTLQKALGPL
jgi:hypothetical protein